MKTETLLKRVEIKLLECNNPAEVKKMIETHFEYASRKYTTVKSICECIVTIY